MTPSYLWLTALAAVSQAPATSPGGVQAETVVVASNQLAQIPILAARTVSVSPTRSTGSAPRTNTKPK